MSVVTWGNNTVHSINANPLPAPSTFGFGATTPASSGALTTTTAPAPSGALFGQQVPQQQLPAQAAIQAKMSAERVVENERIRKKLEKLHRIYSGSYAVPEDGDASAKFCTIVYNDLSAEEIQIRMIHGMTTGYPEQQRSNNNDFQQQQSMFRPPRPNQICGKDWDNAIVSNPDPSKYVPTPVLGAIALQARVANQQRRAEEYSKNSSELKKNLEFIRERKVLASQVLMEKDRQYAHLRRRLLELMKKVDLARCINQPFQPDEHRCYEQLMTLVNLVEKLQVTFGSLQNQAKTLICNGRRTRTLTSANSDDDVLGVDRNDLLCVLMEQRRKLEVMTQTARNDLRDLELISREL